MCPLEAENFQSWPPVVEIVRVKYTNYSQAKMF